MRQDFFVLDADEQTTPLHVGKPMQFLASSGKSEVFPVMVRSDFLSQFWHSRLMFHLDNF